MQVLVERRAKLMADCAGLLALAAGCGLAEAAYISNAAAGVVVAKLGTATVSMAELRRALRASRPL